MLCHTRHIYVYILLHLHEHLTHVFSNHIHCEKNDHTLNTENPLFLHEFQHYEHLRHLYDQNGKHISCNYSHISLLHVGLTDDVLNIEDLEIPKKIEFLIFRRQK